MAEMTEEEMTTKKNVDRQAYEGAIERVIDFVVDTVTVDKAAGAAAYFQGGANTITSNYVVDEDENSHQYNQSGETLTHEQKHRDNYLQGFYAYAVSPEQAYKRNMHDEISATMTELISLREEYIKTGDINVFDRIPKLSFYKEAIEKGEINPKSQYKEDFDKDMRFIVNGTQKMWVEKYGRDFYIDNCLWEYANRGDHEGKYAAYWDQNYQNSLKIAYNIGGVDFTQYMDKDVEIPKEANAKMIEEITNSPSMQEYYHLTDAQVFEKSGFPPYDGGMSLNEYKKLLQHQMAVNNKFSNIWNEEGQKYTPQGYMEHLVSDEHKKEEKKLYETICSKNADFRKKYPNFAAFQYSQCEYDREQLNNALQENNEAFIDKMVEYQAAEYAKTGKDFPDDNPENYQKALNKLYCGAYDVLKPDENNLKSNLSANAKKIADESNKGWFDKLLDKAQSLKHRLTYIKDEEDEFDNEKYVGLWGKIKHKASQIKKDLTTEIEVDENGEEWKGKCSVWKGLKNKVSNWFKASPQQEPVKNEPINPVNKGTPEYPKWSKDKRVSEVQHRQIPDMRRPIIQQPTKSGADEQQNHTSSQTATAAKMKSDTSKAQVAAGRPKNKSTSYQSKTILKSTMKKDASKAQKMSQNIGKQKTTTPKVAKIGYKGPTQTQMIKNLCHKVFDR